jgi:hypothetical protein
MKRILNYFKKRREQKYSNVFNYDPDSYQEIQAYVYKDLDLLKKIESIQQSKSAMKFAEKYLKENEELFTRLAQIEKREKYDPEIFNKKITKQPLKNISPIPRHFDTPKSASEEPNPE